MPNRLASETSPYLLQHADNPVNWYPWSEEAFATARSQDKPIFLSIGYSACHWCHVMAHESFEDPDTAALLNEYFICIKVDREERPDLDRIYMAAVQAMTGSGGWPMSVFLTPEGKPFYGGTYFPPEPRHGMPALAQVLTAIAQAWRMRRAELRAGAESVAQAIERASALGAGPGPAELDPATLDAAVAQLAAQFDWAHGGWGTAPKFPQPMVVEFLLQHHCRTGDGEALRVATTTLDAMARGGIYDQIGGGFHRYSVDEGWLVPHFEKMLYDNALLARVYLHAWQLTGSRLYRSIVEETLGYVGREMVGPEGGFYSTQDADSEGKEGKFYVWTTDEIDDVLGEEAGPFLGAYGVTRQGNFEGKNVLKLVGDLEQRAALGQPRRRLFEARGERVHPSRDEKVLTSWNGLMLAAFAEAARALNRGDYRQIAERSAGFLLSELVHGNGRLLHTWKRRPEQGEGAGKARLNGYLEDYAYLVASLLELYQTTFAPRWFTAAQRLADTMIEHFQAPEGGFFDTSDDHEALITRPRDLQDNAAPSGNAMASTALLKLAGLTGDTRYADLAQQSLAHMQSVIGRYPLSFGQWLQTLSFALSRPREIAIVGDPEAADTQALLRVVQKGYRPFQVVALAASSPQPPAVPLVQDRGLVDGRAAAYVCRGFVCQMPVTEPDELGAQLE
jgi:uncharacterized protein YyaL (SSP411 family)